GTGGILSMDSSQLYEGSDRSRSAGSASAMMPSGESATASRPFRVAVLFSRLSGYAGACLKALSELHGVDLLVIRTPQAENAPLEDRYFDWIGALYDRSRLRASEMSSIITEFAPDALYVSGWFDRDYLRIARQQKQRGTFVVAGVDRQWLGTPRQHL